MSMDIYEKAKIVAFARLLGVTGTDKEVIDRFASAYDEAVKSFQSEPPQTAKAEPVPRLF